MEKTIQIVSLIVVFASMWFLHYDQKRRLEKHVFSDHPLLDAVTVRIRYLDRSVKSIKKIPQGDWIDLRAAETVRLKAGEYYNIRLGIAMEIPYPYEALIVARSSMLARFGLISPNGVNVIDRCYCGDEDEWRFPVLAVRDTTIHFNDRICQFRLIKNQPAITFNMVEWLNNPNRGGFGSTGRN